MRRKIDLNQEFPILVCLLLREEQNEILYLKQPYCFSSEAVSYIGCIRFPQLIQNTKYNNLPGQHVILNPRNGTAIIYADLVRNTVI